MSGFIFVTGVAGSGKSTVCEELVARGFDAHDTDENGLAAWRHVFLCGTTSNELEVWPLFSQVICLTVDEATLRHRLLTRTSNDWGKSPSELDGCLQWRPEKQRRDESMGAVLVDACQPLSAVVDRVLGIVGDGGADRNAVSVGPGN